MASLSKEAAYASFIIDELIKRVFLDEHMRRLVLDDHMRQLVFDERVRPKKEE